MRTDSLDVNSLVSYINDIKPFHSKLTDVTIEYQANDNMYVKFSEDHSMSMVFSSVWELNKVSDGIRTQYRIPAAVFPRYSDDFHQCDRIGVTDAIPGAPDSYAIPYNNSVDITVNGVAKILGQDYFLDSTRTTVQFATYSIPNLNDDICINWSVVDRVFIGISTTQVVAWQAYDLEYNSVTDGMDMYPYDTYQFDNNNDNVSLTGPQTDVRLEPFGQVKIINDSTRQPYYVFEFYKALPLNTNVWIRVEQREAYNGWTQTTFTEEVKVYDLFRYYDTVNAWIVDPGTWNVDHIDGTYDSINGFDSEPFDSGTAALLFGIDIGQNLKLGNFDKDALDIVPFDSEIYVPTMGYYTLFTISETLVDNITPTFTDGFVDQVTLINGETATSLFSDASVIKVSNYPTDTMSGSILENAISGLDTEAFDLTPLDPYSEFISVSTPGSNDVTSTGVKEGFVIAVTDITTGITTYQSSYTPDANGMVDVTIPSTTVVITHDYGYNPATSVYLNGQLLLPLSIDYPQVGVVLINFSAPRAVMVHLV